MAVAKRKKHMVYSVDINTDTFVKYYNREKLKHAKRKRINSDFQKVRRIVSEICKQVKEAMINSEGGVLMKGWGYFYVNRSYTKALHYKRVGGKIVGLDLNFSNGGYKYHTVFLPKLDGRKNFYGWSMDYTFTELTWRAVKANLKKGWRYKAFPFTVIRLKLL